MVKVLSVIWIIVYIHLAVLSRNISCNIVAIDITEKYQDIAQSTNILDWWELNCLKAENVRPSKYVKFYLYTSKRQHPQLLCMNNTDSIMKASFLKDAPVKIIIHGWTMDYNKTPNTEIRPAYLNSGKYNVISVDYNPLARDKCYITSVRNVPTIANCTAQLIDFLVEKRRIPLNNIHVIGFSLGGQIAGQTANYVTVGRLPRITGLDPALPLFSAIHSKKDRLDSEDAEFVDVIHTNAGFKGKLEPTGHVDFYVNGGFRQPGCEAAGSSCDHNRAPKYFAESITTKVGFWSRRCVKNTLLSVVICDEEDGEYIEMGDKVPREARGIYHLRTNDKPPFALGSRMKR